MAPWKKLFVPAFAALVLAGCADPAVNVALRRARLAPQRVYYVQAERFKTSDFPPPPSFGSAAQEADIAVVFDWQKKRTRADCAKAGKTADLTYESFLGDMKMFPVPLPPEVRKFLTRLYVDISEATGAMKERYKRPRPYKAYPGRAVPCIKKSGSFSYPSGHTAVSRAFAHVLADIAPEKKADFFKKADEIALDRVIGGVHYPADIAAGKIFADQFHAELLKSEAYRKDVETAKTFLVK